MSFKDRNFCSRVFLDVQKQKLLPNNSHYLLAVSGGLDSMVLLDFFRRFASKKFHSRFVVAHLDHGLRTESAEDAEWLKSYCQKRELDFVSQGIAISNLLADSTHSSIEALAREQRYAWLLAQAQKFDCPYIVTAHHANDQAETILMRLIRGSHQGLSGMAYQRELGDKQLIRPFLSLNREELEAYAKHHQIPWREDMSNQNQDFFRNRVRSQLLPLLQNENPQLLQQLNSHAQNWREDQNWLHNQAQNCFRNLVTQTTDGFQLKCSEFHALHPALQRALLREVLTAYLGQWRVYSQVHIEAIRELASGPGAKSLNLPEALNVSKHHGLLVFQCLTNGIQP